MKKFLLPIVTVMILLCARLQSSAWSGPGHRIVAAIAYRELSSADRSTVDDLLKQHPAYGYWRADFATSGVGFDLGTYAFMRSSTWADEILHPASAVFTNYLNPGWHYVDYPLRPAANFPGDPIRVPGSNVVHGITQCELSLASPTGTAKDRAIHLALLVHYAGDIHQPLHCATLVTSTYPNGDRGGNDFYVKTNNGSVKLHSLWDQGLGLADDLTAEYNYAIRLAAAHSRATYPQLAAHTTPESWSLEGRGLAITNAYLLGNLRGGTDAAGAVAVPSGYQDTLKIVAEKQGPLAGHRLADEIHKHLVAVNYPPPVVPSVVPTSFDPHSLVAWVVKSQSGYGVSPLSPATNASHVTGSGLVRGAGVGTSGSGASHAWGGNNFTSTNAAGAISGGKFITFTVSPSAGSTLSCSTLAGFYYRRSAGGPANGLLQYQIGSGAFNDITSFSYSSTASTGGSIPPVDLTGIAALQNVGAGTTVTFRIVNWGGSATGTWYVFDSAENPGADFALLGVVKTPIVNLAPVAVASATPTSGATPLAVTFSSTGSSDPEGAALTYNWTFGDGTSSASANPSHNYSAPGIYGARLTVSDGNNTTVSANMIINATSSSRLPAPANLRVTPGP